MLVSRWAQDCDLGAPLTIVGICIIYLEGHAGVSTVTLHRAIQRQPDGSALETEKSGSPVLRRLERHSKT